MKLICYRSIKGIFIFLNSIDITRMFKLFLTNELLLKQVKDSFYPI